MNQLKLVLLLIIVIQSGCLKEKTAKVFGYITSKNTNEGIENCRITIGLFSTFTSSTGYYQIDNVPHGELRIKISDKCYFMDNIIPNGEEYEYNAQFQTECTDPRDQKIYKVVEINEQIWMAENLNYGELIESTLDQTDNGIVEKYCLGNDESECSEYGGYYQWDEMMEYKAKEGAQGICPEGWHIPTFSEYDRLVQSLLYYAGLNWDLVFHALKQPDNPHWTVSYGEDYWLKPTGFDAIPGGYRDADGNFIDVNSSANFCTANEGGAFRLINDQQSYELAFVSQNKKHGLSVRCIKD